MTAWGQSGFADASLEQLLNTQITSVAKKEAKRARAANSVRRSGATTIPDLLRMKWRRPMAGAPDGWVVTIPGFNRRDNNKVLVLVEAVCGPGARVCGLHNNFRLQPSPADAFSVPLAGNTPRDTIQARSSINCWPRPEWDRTVYWPWVFANGTVPTHTRIDTRLARKAGESVELSLIGQNLLRSEFPEFGDFQEVVGTQAPRSWIGKIVWRY